MSDSSRLPFDPPWLTVPRALEIVASHFPNKTATVIEQALIEALSGGAIRAVAETNPLDPGRQITPVDRVDWKYIQTLDPSQADLAFAYAPPVSKVRGLINSLFVGLVEISNDDLAAWLTKAAPISPGTMVQHAGTNATSPEMICWHDKWMSEHPRGTQADEYNAMREQFGDQATKRKVADLRRSPDGTPAKRGPKVGKKYTGGAH